MRDHPLILVRPRDRLGFEDLSRLVTLFPSFFVLGIVSLSPTGNRRTGRARSVSELPPRPTSFDGAEVRVSVGGGSTRTSFEQDSLTPSFRPRSGTESFPSRHSPMANNAPPFIQQSAPVLNIPPSVANISNTMPTVAVAIKGHARTTCKCSKDGRHYANTYMTETYPGTIESMWKLLFDSNFSKEFLTSEAMKGADVQEESWKDTGVNSTKTTRYTRWLGMPIGPKTTKAILTDVCEYKNYDDYTTTVTTTSTPDVPSGGSFTTKVRTCITWAGPSQIQVVITGAVEFTKSSWIKSQIEKGAAEGLTVHYKELNKTLRKYIAAHPADFPGPGSVAAPATATTVQTSQPGAVAAPVQIEAQHPSTSQHSFASESEKPPQQPQSRSGPISKSKPVGLLDGFGSILSKALGLFQSSGQENGQMDGPQLALILALAMVMLANVYIWRQISSVTTQMERIQGDLLQGQRPIHTPSKQKPEVHIRPAGGAGSAAAVDESSGSGNRAARPRSVWMDVEEDLREREYEEDVMWAWLTERQARHRQYRRANGYYRPTETMVRMENKKPRASKSMENRNVHNAHEMADDYEEEKEEKVKPFLSESNEVKLQARIQELQDQLLELEQHTTALKVGTRAAELDREQDIPVEN